MNRNEFLRELHSKAKQANANNKNDELSGVSPLGVRKRPADMQNALLANKQNGGVNPSTQKYSARNQMIQSSRARALLNQNSN